MAMVLLVLVHVDPTWIHPPGGGDSALPCVNIPFALCTLFFSQQLQELLQGDKVEEEQTQPFGRLPSLSRRPLPRPACKP